MYGIRLIIYPTYYKCQCQGILENTVMFYIWGKDQKVEFLPNVEE